METSAVNPLVSSQQSSQLQAVLHPLVILTISDYITRHTLREQQIPIVGALLGQQNGREVTIEHAFECHVREAPEVAGGYLLDDHKFSARLEQMVTVHKDRQLEFVGWYTLLPSSGPRPIVLPIHSQILESWNESALLLAFHPEQVLEHSVGGKLPLTVYESSFEVEGEQADGEDRKMDDGDGSTLRLKFREVPYSVETDETEMISMNYVAGGGGSAAAAREDRALSVESTGKGKRRLVENEEAQDAGEEEEHTNLSRSEDEMMSSLTAKANAVKMLQSRINLLIEYLERLPPSFVSGEAGAMDTDNAEHTTPSAVVLRQIQALVARLDLVIPSDSESFAKEVQSETNDVRMIDMLAGIIRSVDNARDVGKKFGVVDAAAKVHHRRTAHDMVAGGFGPGSSDLMM